MFHVNQVCFDRAAKEIVKITNGTQEGDTFIPTEAMALRVLGVTSDRHASIGFTYRNVDPTQLYPLSESQVFSEIGTVKHWLGRV